MLNLHIKLIDCNGDDRFHVTAAKIDICESHTIIYMPHVADCKAECFTVRFPFSLKTINVVRGTVTAYFNNGSYLIINSID